MFGQRNLLIPQSHQRPQNALNPQSGARTNLSDYPIYLPAFWRCRDTLLSILCPDFQSVESAGSLLRVMKRNPKWARIIVAIFTMAVLYVSLCSTTCAIGFCPYQAQHFPAHDCDQAPSHHSHQPGHQTPDHPDCFQHQHPGSFLANSGNPAQFQLSVANNPNVAVTDFSARHGLTVTMTDSQASDLAPPLRSNSPLYQQISVLRI